ncbi:MAG: fibro-slime domain-containing protein [Fibrobacteria bacterium]|nr:fibro-slime domain-containing protein [Fibrobacteria bacterium]
MLVKSSYLIKTIFVVMIVNLVYGADTLKVTYHDFYGSHPDFTGKGDARRFICANKTNTANDPAKNIFAAELGADRKPNKSGKSCASYSGDQRTECNECRGLDAENWFENTSANKTFDGFLIDQNPATPDRFEYKDNTFFPIDTVKGAEKWSNHPEDGGTHNHLFCMEAHTEFPYMGEEVFNFTGDDDVFVYINNRLAMDLGGVHGALNGVVDLDAQAEQLGITKGNVYNFDFFYCERHYHGSKINIETSLKIFDPVVLPPPVADPPGGAFAYRQSVILSNSVPDVGIYYRLSATENYRKYTGTAIDIIETVTLEAYAEKEGWINSDTISHVFTKTNNSSTLQAIKITGEPLGGTSYLTENDSSFIVKLTAPFAGLTSVQVMVTTATGLDNEVITITHPQADNNALIFIDTVNFAAGTAISGNGAVEAAAYDDVGLSWQNPLYAEDNPQTSFKVKPSPQDAQIYFADSSWNELTGPLQGNESMVYVVVEDAAFDPTRLQEYVVTLTNTKGDGNGGKPDQEILPLIELQSGKYGVSLPVHISPPVTSANGFYEIRIGDQLKADYTNPVTLQSRTDLAGFGVPSQLPGHVSFTNADGTTPPELMPGNIWDAGKGNVYITYTDDYVASITKKSAIVTVTSTDALGQSYTDMEQVSLTFLNKTGDAGVWTAILSLEDTRAGVTMDGKLQYYFKAQLKVDVAQHMTGTSERFSGDTAHAVMTVAKANTEESIILTDAKSSGVVTRHSESIKVCVEDQVFSSASTDTLLLDEIECKSSGDMLKNVKLVQQSPDIGIYCAEIQKREAVTGSVMDDTLHCQDIDNIVAGYSDPIYGTSTTRLVSFLDDTPSSISFYDIAGSPVSVFDEAGGNQIKVRLMHKSPNLYQPDTLRVKLKTDTGDTLDILVFETGDNTAVFDGSFIIGFSNESNLRNNILEGSLDLESTVNEMNVTATSGSALASVTVAAAYIPAERAWIVDGNHDGQGDSIYIQFKAPVYNAPATISSIDWPYEGAQGHIAENDPFNSEPMISLHDDFVTVSVLLPGALDNTLSIFPPTETNIPFNQDNPMLTLPEGTVFQGQEVAIEDGIGAVVKSVTKLVSDNSYYKDTEGYLQKQPDTLIITLSEKIRAVHASGTPWDSLFFFTAPNMSKSEAFPLISLAGSKPTVKGPDSLEWTFIVDNGLNTIKPMVDDELFMNPDAPYVDVSERANKPQNVAKLILGKENPDPINYSTIFVPVIGSGLNDPRTLMANMYLNEDGTITPGRDVVMVRDTDGSFDYSRTWIKPQGLQRDGSILPPGAECLGSLSETAGQSEFPDNCISTVQVFSTDGYLAEITIFDHLGKFVHQSVQSFGKCGELDNQSRRTARGLQSWLVWNQKDLAGNFVGSGVYLWKVKFNTSAGTHTAIYRQGIVRSGVEPEDGCAQ